MSYVLDFEKPILELEKKVAEMKSLAGSLDLDDQIADLERRIEELRSEIYSKLTRWQRVQLARHPERPYTLDYLAHSFDEFIELHGDRCYRDDPAIVGGLARIGEHKVVVVGHQKGRDTKTNVLRNFGMPNPEGYRKARRLFELAEKFDRPIVTFLDTPGAFPGIEAEERGQAEAIARNLFVMAKLRVPIVVVIIGEGASGGALGIGVGDRILMLENVFGHRTGVVFVDSLAQLGLQRASSRSAPVVRARFAPSRYHRSCRARTDRRCASRSGDDVPHDAAGALGGTTAAACDPTGRVGATSARKICAHGCMGRSALATIIVWHNRCSPRK
jgi:acetyl-CoA carboxylase carboxyl transferase alpha subunit